jgi:hypothetical protein
MSNEFKEYNTEDIKKAMGKRKTLKAEIIQNDELHSVVFHKQENGDIIMEHDLSANMDLRKPAKCRIIEKTNKKNTGFIIVWIGTYGSEHSVLNDVVYNSKDEAIGAVTSDIRVNNHHCYNDQCISDIIPDIEETLAANNEIRIPSGDSYTIHEITID